MLALLALIGLKKFRSFQKPNRIARTFDAFEIPFGGPEASFRLITRQDLGEIVITILGAQRRVFGLELDNIWVK